MPMREIGIEAVRLLLNEIERPRGAPVARVLEARLIVRTTSGPAPSPG
jgi:DNA-binding LacI/PurR family transcriptional regulator